MNYIILLYYNYNNILHVKKKEPLVPLQIRRVFTVTSRGGPTLNKCGSADTG